MSITTDDDDATVIQPAAVRDFNQQLAEAYMNPQDYRPLLPPETSTPLPDDPEHIPAPGSSTPGTPPAPAPSPAGARPRRAQPKQRIWPWILALIGTLLLGIWAGSGTNPVKPIGAPLPAVTITAEPQPEIRAVTPKACIDALRAADQAFDIAFKTLGVIGEQQNTADAKAAKREYRRQLEPVGRTYWTKRDVCYTSR